MFALAPLPVVYTWLLPNLHAHLSAFSNTWPFNTSYHALPSGSVFVSSISCAVMLTSASATESLLGEAAPCRASHGLHPGWSKSRGMAPNFTSFPFQAKLPCSAQAPRWNRLSCNGNDVKFGAMPRLFDQPGCR